MPAALPTVSAVHGIGVMYLILWVFPVFILMKDFLHFEDFRWITDAKFLRVLWFTFYQAVLSTVLSFLVALLPALYIYKKKNLLSSLLKNSIFIPFFFPPVSMVISFSLIFGSTGVLSRMGIHLSILYTLPAILIAHVFYNSPIFVNYLGNALRNTDAAMVESAKIDGAGRLKRFIHIEWPLVLPSAFKAFFLVFTYSFTSFAVVLNLGGIRFTTIEVAINTILRSQFDFSSALVYAIVQFGVLFALNLLLYRFGNVVHERGVIAPLKESAGFFSVFAASMYVVFEYGIVAVGLSGIFFDFYNQKWSFDAFLRLFSESFNRRFPVIRSITNSTLIAGIAGFFTVVVAYLFLKTGKRITDVFILPILGVSSAFLAMALLYLNILYEIPFFLLIVVGYFLISLPIGYSFLFQSVRGLRKDILEAGRIDGANRIKIIFLIELPILFPSFIAVFFQIFAIIFGEFTLSYTMQIRDFFPLASVLNYSLSVQRYYRESAAFGSLNTIIVFGLFMISSAILARMSKVSSHMI